MTTRGGTWDFLDAASHKWRRRCRDVGSKRLVQPEPGKSRISPYYSQKVSRECSLPRLLGGMSRNVGIVIGTIPWRENHNSQQLLLEVTVAGSNQAIDTQDITALIPLD